MKFDRVCLEGEHVQLKPLEDSHHEGLVKAIQSGELWNLFVTLVPDPQQVEQFIRDSINSWERGEGLTFATIDRPTNKPLIFSRPYGNA